MTRAIILAVALSQIVQAQLVTENFNNNTLPPYFTVQAGTANVSGGQLTLDTACVQISRPNGDAVFSNAQGLSVEADVRIQDAAQGDFIVYGLYDSLPNCVTGPNNGYYAGWYPNLSDSSNDDILRFTAGSYSTIASTPTTLLANSVYRLRVEFLADGTIRTFINGVLKMSVVDTSRQSGFVSLRSWRAVDVDNLVVSTLASATDSAFQVSYSANLNLGDSYINATNSGARGAGLAAGTSASTTGAFCLNVYAFSPDEQMVACCSCPVTPNGLVKLSVLDDVVYRTLTPAVPTAIVVKLYSTVPQSNSCNAASPGPPANGLLAWSTTLHGFKGPGLSGLKMTETPFLPATLSTIGGRAGGSDIGELGRLTQLCGFIQANGSTYGICKSCTIGALGAGRL